MSEDKVQRYKAWDLEKKIFFKPWSKVQIPEDQRGPTGQEGYKAIF